MNVKPLRDRLNAVAAGSSFLHWSVLFVVTAIFVIIIYPDLIVTTHRYALGDVAERDIKAPQDYFIEDPKATQINRRKALDEALTVYDHDSGLAAKLAANVTKAFGGMRQIRREQPPPPDSADRTAPPSGAGATVHERIWQAKETFEGQLGATISPEAFRILESEGFGRRIAEAIARILVEIMRTGVATDKAFLLREADKGIVLRDVLTQTESVETDLDRFYDLDQARAMVRRAGAGHLADMSYTLRSLIVDVVQALLQPNITLNRNETEERKKAAVAAIKPVLYRIKAGEMIVREGERISEFQLQKLNGLRAQAEKKQVLAIGLGATALLLCLLVIVYLLCFRRHPRFRADERRNLLLTASVFVLFLFLAHLAASLAALTAGFTGIVLPASALLYGVPLAAGAMIVGLFLGFDLALPFAVVLAVCAALISGNRLEMFLYYFLSAGLGAFWIRRCRERKVFITAGLKLGCLNVLLAVALDLYLADFAGAKLAWDLLFAFLGGMGAGVIAAGLGPLAEMTFGYTTDITLLELANLDRPILRRLMIEAPGTYHHSVIVGSLVEVAAAEIGANPLMAKVCGYYHDIGKINKPLYFIENQSGGRNRHDKLAPSMSSLILINHIKNGVEIARAHKLGGVIIDTIRQHHGTSLIKYFYQKAVMLRGSEAVNIDDFRYPGPKPQSREAGLVMLADVVEAASRTLDNPTPARIKGLVQNLINGIFSDGQLDECDLTLRNLHRIAKSFTTILTGIHHHRIEYPEKTNGKGRHVSPDHQPTKPPITFPRKGAPKGPGHLRRLGHP